MESWVPELPKDVIRRIINNHLLCKPTFSNKEAIQLSLVSKEFLSAVQRRSVLVFEWKKDDDPKLKELEYMISTLTRYHNQGIHLDTFNLSFLSDKHETLMNQCIQLATANNLRNLDISMPWTKSFVLTQSVFQVESLVQLDLNHCSLQQAESMIITWSNLKRLHLCCVLMEERVFEDIIRGCPMIEILEIFYSCPNISKFNLKAFNLGYLMKLVIRFCTNQTFELGTTAPNLESLALTHASNLRIDLREYEYHKLKSLSLSLKKDFNADFLINLAHRFPVLEDLHIHQLMDGEEDCKMLNISSPSLKNIKLVNFQRLQKASFDVPNIVSFTFDNNIIPKFSIVGNPSGWTSHIKFKICNDSTDTSWFLKLKEYLDAINMSEASVGIYFKEAVTCFNIIARAQKSADSNTSFPRIIQYLNMTWLNQNKAFSLPFDAEILNGILMIFRPQMMILDSQDCELPQVMYDHLMLTKFDNMWDVTCIYMHKYQSLTLQQVSDRRKFLEMLKGVDDDRSKNITISFTLKYVL